MFWNMTIRRLGASAIPVFPTTYAARPDLETGTRLLALATEGGILLTLSGPPREGIITACNTDASPSSASGPSPPWDWAACASRLSAATPGP